MACEKYKTPMREPNVQEKGSKRLFRVTILDKIISLVMIVALVTALVISFSGCRQNGGENDGNGDGFVEDNGGNGSGNKPEDKPDDSSSNESENKPENKPDDETGNESGDNSENKPGDNTENQPEEPLTASGSLKVTTTSTYCYVDKYSFTAPLTGSYTFTVPAGLGFISSLVNSPEIDFQLKTEGGKVNLSLEEGSVISFLVGSTEKGNWTINWSAVECEVTVKPETKYDIIIDADDADGYSFTYTATKSGTLTVTVDDLAYDYSGNGRFTVADSGAFELGFPRMYRLVINGVVYKTHEVTVPVGLGDRVTIQLYCQYGYATKANIETVINTAGDNSDVDYPDDKSYSFTIDAGDTDGYSFNYTVGVSGDLVITVTDLAYDWKGEGNYTEADADTLYYGFSKMYALVINGENVGAYTTTLKVKAGDKITVQLYSHHGYATKATVIVGYSVSNSAGSGSDSSSLGTEKNPIIINEIPESLSFVSDAENKVYYRFTADKSGTVTFTWPTADSWYMITELNSDGSNTRNGTSGYLTESFTFEVTEGKKYSLSLGTWTSTGDITVVITTD